MMNTESPVWYSTAIPEEQEIYREWLQGVLREHTVDLTFRKKDDTMREMKCTLIESMLPVIEKKTDRIRKENKDVLSVFDLEKNEWRSFRYDSIEALSFDLGK